MFKMKKLKFNLLLNLKRILCPCIGVLQLSSPHSSTNSHKSKSCSHCDLFQQFFSVPSKVCLGLQGTYVIGYNCVIFPQVAFIWQVHYPLPPAKDLTGKTLIKFVNILFSEPLTEVLTETLSFSIVSFTHNGYSLFPNSHKSRQWSQC